MTQDTYALTEHAAGFLARRIWAAEVEDLPEPLREVLRRAARDAERFARNGAKWAAELARVDAEIVRRGASPTDDMAAYGGEMNRSIARSVRHQMSDSNITRMVWLHKRRAELRRLLALGNVRQGAS